MHAVGTMQLILIIQKCAHCVWRRLLRANIFALYDFYLPLTFVSFVLYNTIIPKIHVQGSGI